MRFKRLAQTHQCRDAGIDLARFEGLPTAGATLLR